MSDIRDAKEGETWKATWFSGTMVLIIIWIGITL